MCYSHIERLRLRHALASVVPQKAIVRAKHFGHAHKVTGDRRHALKDAYGGWAPQEPYDALCDLREAYLDAEYADFPEPSEERGGDYCHEMGPWVWRTSAWTKKDEHWWSPYAPMSADVRLLAACALTGRAAPRGLRAIVTRGREPFIWPAEAERLAAEAERIIVRARR